MILKFLLLSLFLAVNISITFAQKSAQGGSPGSGGANIMDRIFSEMVNEEDILQVLVLDNNNQEIDRIDHNLLEDYIQLLAPGKYKAVYINREDSIIDRVEFTID